MASISSSELVMRARHLVFHVRCFSCTVCNSPLTKGDQFGMRDSSIFCRSHYEIALESPTTTSTPLGMTCQYSQYGSSPNGHTSPSSSENAAMKMGASSGYYGPATPHSMTGGLPQTPRQKGRPRKRKPKDIEAMTTNLGKFHCNQFKSFENDERHKLIWMHFDIYFVVPDTFMFPRSLDFEQINFMRFFRARAQLHTKCLKKQEYLLYWNYMISHWMKNDPCKNSGYNNHPVKRLVESSMWTFCWIGN